MSIIELRVLPLVVIAAHFKAMRVAYIGQVDAIRSSLRSYILAINKTGTYAGEIE